MATARTVPIGRANVAVSAASRAEESQSRATRASNCQSVVRRTATSESSASVARVARRLRGKFRISPVQGSGLALWHVPEHGRVSSKTRISLPEHGRLQLIEIRRSFWYPAGIGDLKSSCGGLGFYFSS